VSAGEAGVGEGEAEPAKFEAESATSETHIGVAPDGPLSLSRFNYRLTECEGHPDMMKGAAACHLACNAASKEETRYCTSSTGTPVISRNASGMAGQCTVYPPSRGSPCLGGIVDHKSE